MLAVYSFCFSTEPNAPPANISGHNTGPTSILVQWDQVPAADKNGVILSYTVTYKAILYGPKRSQTVPDTQVSLTKLNEHTNYSITVFASTIKGDGNESEPIIVITDEDSKSVQKYIVCLSKLAVDFGVNIINFVGKSFISMWKEQSHPITQNRIRLPSTRIRRICW